jgi:hypothetical protein
MGCCNWISGVGTLHELLIWLQGLVRFSVNGARAVLSSPVSPPAIVLLSRSDIKISFLFGDWARNTSQLPAITARTLRTALLRVLKAFRPRVSLIYRPLLPPQFECGLQATRWHTEPVSHPRCWWKQASEWAELRQIFKNWNRETGYQSHKMVSRKIYEYDEFCRTVARGVSMQRAATYPWMTSFWLCTRCAYWRHASWLIRPKNVCLSNYHTEYFPLDSLKSVVVAETNEQDTLRGVKHVYKSQGLPCPSSTQHTWYPSSRKYWSHLRCGSFWSLCWLEILGISWEEITQIGKKMWLIYSCDWLF